LELPQYSEAEHFPTEPTRDAALLTRNACFGRQVVEQKLTLKRKVGVLEALCDPPVGASPFRKDTVPLCDALASQVLTLVLSSVYVGTALDCGLKLNTNAAAA
jgi:hypothetical protein